MKKIRERHLNQLKEDQEARNQSIIKKLGNERTNRKGSLPEISGNKATDALLLRGPGEEWRVKNAKSKEGSLRSKEDLNPIKLPESSRTLEPSYDRLVMDKLRDVSILVRKSRKI